LRDRSNWYIIRPKRAEMRWGPWILPVCLSFLAVAPARAQQAQIAESVPADWEQRADQLRAWLSEDSEWKAWYEKFRNRPERGWAGYEDRRKRPEPPLWLEAECASLLDAEGLLGAACDLLQELKTGIPAKPPALPYREEPPKTIWWEHVHLDALWPMAQWQSNVYGVVGVHATITVKGRFQLFVAPGAILLNLPNGRSRDWQPATDWGVAFRLTDFRFPGTGQWVSLHFNFAEAWLLTGQPAMAKSKIELAGFSFTFKRDPR